MGYFRQGSFTNLPIVGIPGAILAVGIAIIVAVGVPGAWVFIVAALAGGILVAILLVKFQVHRLGAIIVSVVCLGGFAIFFPGVGILLLVALLCGSILAWIRYRSGRKSEPHPTRSLRHGG